MILFPQLKAEGVRASRFRMAPPSGSSLDFREDSSLSARVGVRRREAQFRSFRLPTCQPRPGSRTLIHRDSLLEPCVRLVVRPRVPHRVRERHPLTFREFL